MFKNKYLIWKVIIRILLGAAIGICSVALCNAVDFELTDGMRYTPPVEPPMRFVSQFLDSVFGDALWITIPLMPIGIVIIIDIIRSRIQKKKLFRYSLITLFSEVTILMLATVAQTVIK